MTGGSTYFGGRKRKSEDEADQDYLPNSEKVQTSDASEIPQEDIDMREWKNDIQDQLETSDEEELQENDGEEQNLEEELISIVGEPAPENADNENKSQNWKEGCMFKCNMCEVITNTRGDMKKHCIVERHGKGTVNCYTIHTKGIYVCLMCSKSVMQESHALSDHMHREHTITLRNYEKRFHSDTTKTALEENDGRSPLTRKRKSVQRNTEVLMVPVPKQAQEADKEDSNEKQNKEESVSIFDEPSSEKLGIETITQNWADGCTFKCNKCEVTALSRAEMAKHCITSGHGRINSHKLITRENFVCKLCDASILHESNVISDHMIRVHKSTLEKYGERFHSDKSQPGVENRDSNVKSPAKVNQDCQGEDVQVEDLVPLTILSTNDEGTTHSIFGNTFDEGRRGNFTKYTPDIASHSIQKSHKMPKKWNEGCIFKCKMCSVTKSDRVKMRIHCVTSGHGKGTKECYTILLKSTYVCFLCSKPILWDPLSIQYHLDQLHKVTVGDYEKRFHSDSNSTSKRKNGGSPTQFGKLKTPRIKLRKVEDMLPISKKGSMTTVTSNDQEKKIFITSAFSIAKNSTGTPENTLGTLGMSSGLSRLTPGKGPGMSSGLTPGKGPGMTSGTPRITPGNTPPWSEGCQFKCNTCKVRTIRRIDMKRHCRETGHGKGTVDCYKMTKKYRYSCRICKSSLWHESTVIRDHTIKVHKMSLKHYEERFHPNGRNKLVQEINNKISNLHQLKTKQQTVEYPQARDEKMMIMRRSQRLPNTNQNQQPNEKHSQQISSMKESFSNISITKVTPNQQDKQPKEKSIVDELSKYPNIELSKVNPNLKRREDQDDDIQEILHVSHPQERQTASRKEQELEEENGLLRLKLNAAEAQIKVLEAELRRRPRFSR